MPQMKQNVAPIEIMAKLPTFKDDEQYEIKVHSAVEMAPTVWARPSSPKIVVSGAVARQLGDVIVWARKV